MYANTSDMLFLPPEVSSPDCLGEIDNYAWWDRKTEIVTTRLNWPRAGALKKEVFTWNLSKILWFSSSSVSAHICSLPFLATPLLPLLSGRYLIPVSSEPQNCTFLILLFSLSNANMCWVLKVWMPLNTNISKRVHILYKPDWGGDLWKHIFSLTFWGIYMVLYVPHFAGVLYVLLLPFTKVEHQIDRLQTDSLRKSYISKLVSDLAI